MFVTISSTITGEIQGDYRRQRIWRIFLTFWLFRSLAIFLLCIVADNESQKFHRSIGISRGIVHRKCVFSTKRNIRKCSTMLRWRLIMSRSIFTLVLFESSKDGDSKYNCGSKSISVVSNPFLVLDVHFSALAMHCLDQNTYLEKHIHTRIHKEKIARCPEIFS